VKWNSGTDNYGQFNPLVPLRLLYPFGLISAKLLASRSGVCYIYGEATHQT
jgi:hypothetical protein